MNIPSLPTDNLYKFIAIFGLLISFFSIYIIYQSDKEAENAEIRMMVEKQKLRKEFDNFELWLNTIDENQSSNGEDRSITITIDKLENKKNVQVKLKKLDSLQVVYEMEKSLFENMVNSHNELFWYLTFLALLGGAMVAYGFRQWYYKYQIYIDAEVKYKGMKYIEKLKIKEQQDKLENEPESQNQEPKPDTESKSDS